MANASETFPITIHVRPLSFEIKRKNSVFKSATENSDIYVFSFHFTCIPDVWVRLSPSSDQAENPSLASALA